jgi:hypothetical protein
LAGSFSVKNSTRCIAKDTRIITYLLDFQSAF